MQSFFHVIISPAKNQKREVKNRYQGTNRYSCLRGVLSIIYDVFLLNDSTIYLFPGLSVFLLYRENTKLWIKPVVSLSLNYSLLFPGHRL